MVVVLVLVVVVGASRERAVVKVGESSGLSGAVERIMAVFKSKSPPAAATGERRGDDEEDSSTLSASSTLMMVAWCTCRGAGGGGGTCLWKTVILVQEDHRGIITLTGGNGKRDFLST